MQEALLSRPGTGTNPLEQGIGEGDNPVAVGAAGALYEALSKSRVV